MFDLQHWLDEYVSAVDAAFGARIEFIGLQGSYARGEQHEGSDIDVVLLLDKLTVESTARRLPICRSGICYAALSAVSKN